MSDKKLFDIGAIVWGSQFNGIVWYGIVVAYVRWDATETVTHYLIRYLFDPDGDPPRKGYRLVAVDEIKEGLPSWTRREKLVLADE